MSILDSRQRSQIKQILTAASMRRALACEEGLDDLRVVDEAKPLGHLMEGVYSVPLICVRLLSARLHPLGRAMRCSSPMLRIKGRMQPQQELKVQMTDF